MLTFYYIEQWHYYHPHSFPTLNLLLFPVQTYGINLMGYDHIIRTRPMPSLTMPPSHRRIWRKKRHLWTNWWKPISLSHTNMLLLRLLMFYLHLRSSLLEHHHRQVANRKPNPVPKAPAKRRRRRNQSRSRSSSPLSLWTSEDKQKLRTLKADEKSRFSWKVISTKMGKSEEDVRSMWNKIKDQLG